MWTDYVVTRSWYRAPELVGRFFCGNHKSKVDYTAKVDVWSMGCIFAELMLGCPLFPGRDTVHQLTLISDLLGKPSDEMINSIPNPKAQAFLNALPDQHEGVNFATRFPNAEPAALDLLRGLLELDPDARMSTREALKHPYFAGNLFSDFFVAAQIKK
jgi:serine/threonine protein kinase